MPAELCKEGWKCYLHQQLVKKTQSIVETCDFFFLHQTETGDMLPL